MSESQEQPMPPKSEISSSVAEANKTRVDKSLQKPKKGISKRQLAQRLITSAVIAANIGIPADHVSKGFLAEEPRGVTRELSLQDLEKRAEQLYQIQIVSPDEFTEVDVGEDKVKTEKWTREELSDLMRVLDKLPPHFYLPRPAIFELHGKFRSDSAWGIEVPDYDSFMNDIKAFTGEDFYISQEEFPEVVEKGYVEIPDRTSKVHFFMVNEFHPKEVIGTCYCNLAGYNDTSKVGLSRDAFHRSPWGTKGTFSIITHELVHSVSNKEDYEFIRDLLGMPKNLNFDSLYGTVSDTNENPVQFANALRGTIIDKDVSYAHEKFKYGLSNPNEFVSVASEFYLFGGDRFIKAYGVYIGEEKSTKLYDYMKDNIFRGTEYKNYQKVTK